MSANQNNAGREEPGFHQNATAGLNDLPFGDDDAAGHVEDHPRAEDSRLGQGPTINSINGAKRKGGSRAAKAVFILVIVAGICGLGGWFVVHLLTQLKEVVHAKNHKGTPGPAADSPNSLNPESTAHAGTATKSRPLGADGDQPPPAGSRASTAQDHVAGADGQDGDVRPIRDDNGKIVINAQGKAMGVDGNGRLVEVPAIGPTDGTAQRGKRPLPGQSSGAGGQQGGAAGSAPPKKPPSRYGGSLLADGMTGSASAQSSAASDASSSKATTSEQRTNDLLRALLQPRGQDTNAIAAATAAAAAQDNQGKQSSGPVASQMASSKMPVAVASRMKDQSLLLPRNRQGNCVLTTRIINELPGFTSCTLTENLYGADGKVVLLERGSEISGEYGNSGQVGLRRLWIVWTRVRTPEGVEVELQSPTADALGTSGAPGYLEQRWAERIGAALLLSVMKDAIALEMERAQPSSSSTVVVTPGQNTVQAGQDIAEQVIKQTINVKPTLYINEGTRVSVYVARDLDFSSVYSLKTVASQAAPMAKVN